MAESDHRSRNWTWRLVAFAVVSMLLVIFIAENFIVVEVRFFVWRTEARLAWALLVAGVLGFVLGMLFPRLRRLL